MTKGSHLYNSQIKEVESRHAKADSIVDEFYATEFAIAASLNDIPALCATVKALRAELIDVKDELRVADDALENQSQWMSESRAKLAGVTQERDDLQSQLAALREEFTEQKRLLRMAQKLEQALREENERLNAIVSAYENQDEEALEEAEKL